MTRFVLDVGREHHFVGLGGAGMSALAEVLLARGIPVSGCDAHPGPVTELLARRGATTFPGHDPGHLAGEAVVVVSAAVPGDLPEVVLARRRGQPVVRRAELLAAIMVERPGIAVAGTHGKSTSTTMVGAILAAAGLDPVVIVGGRIRDEEGNARIGAGEWIVAEADEYDRSFLALSPAHAIVTNVEPDHLDTYGTSEAVREAFATFVERVAADGVVALGADDPGARGLPVPNGRRAVTFGLDSRADVRAVDVRVEGLGSRFRLALGDVDGGEVRLALPGEHNVRNALGAAALAWKLGIEPAAIRDGLEAVRGVERRFEVLATGDGGPTIVHDYAHHPTEIEVTLRSARASWPGNRLTAVFQPHLFSRTRDFAADFGRALAGADRVVVTGVYPAREAPIEGVTGELVARAAERAGAADVTYLESADAAVDSVARRLAADDVVVLMGAGDIDRAAGRLARLVTR